MQGGKASPSPGCRPAREEGFAQHALAQAVALAVVAIVHQVVDVDQSVRRIIEIEIHPVIKQVPVGVEGVIDAVHAFQAVCEVVDIAIRGWNPTHHGLLG
jgi:hypothetical protein